jgi:Concanavalin A-like lectin/glucanases superfamily/Phage tail fibre adhesin Gp38
LKVVQYVEIEPPALSPTMVRLTFDDISSPAVVDDTNSEGFARSWVSHGDAIITSSKFVAGVASLQCTTTGYVDVVDPDLDLGSSDWTIEFYFWRNEAVGTARNISGKRRNAGGTAERVFAFNFDTTGHVQASAFQNATQFLAQSTSVFGVSAAWHHVSFMRKGTGLYLWIDGALEASGANVLFGSLNYTSGGSLAVGRDGDNTTTTYRGWIDEFTIHPYARRDENSTFTPESSLAQVQTASDTVYRFAVDARYLPGTVDAIPSLKEVSIEPATISLGADIGARATVTAKFKDHRHIFDSEDFDSGTFWGKFRARYGLKIRGGAFRVIIGEDDQDFDAMETRHFVIESSNGPTPIGEFQIIAKDILKLADGDRSQAPFPNSGSLAADITDFAASLTLVPTGIGDAEYAAEGYAIIGGSEIAFFTRSSDTITLVSRGEFNANADDHTAGERFQQCVFYDAVGPDVIIADLLTTYAGVDSTFIDTASWAAEIATYVNTVYSALICEPTSVATLISELIEQVGLVIWWDDVNQSVRLQALRPISATADTFDADNIMVDSMDVTEQPDKRLTQVFVYFNQFTPKKSLDQLDNFLSSSFVRDAVAEAEYGGEPLVKTIYSRWIGAGGGSIADQVAEIVLARYRDPPRRISFSLLRGSVSLPALGGGYQIGGWMFQDTDGEAITIPAQITSLKPGPDILEVEAEEISALFPEGGTGGGSSPGERIITIDSDSFEIDLRELHDSLFAQPVSGNVIRCTINTGIFLGSGDVATAALYVGEWPAGVSIFITNKGRIQAKGGAGGNGLSNGQNGGVALRTRQAITLNNVDGEIFGGGGGGGGGGGIPSQGYARASGGGGGAGLNSGSGGVGITNSNGAGANGSPGTSEAGGAGGDPPVTTTAFNGGDGGGPGLAGSATSPSGTVVGNGAAGSAGNAIDGVSFVTFSGSSGDIRGGQVN